MAAVVLEKMEQPLLEVVEEDLERMELQVIWLAAVAKVS